LTSTLPANSFWGSTSITDQNVVRPWCASYLPSAPALVKNSNHRHKANHIIIQACEVPPLKDQGNKPSFLSSHTVCFLLRCQTPSAKECASSVFTDGTTLAFRILLGTSSTATVTKSAKQQVRETQERYFLYYLSSSAWDSITNNVNTPEYEKQQ